MTKIVILATSLIAATCGQAFAYSNVSPKEASHVTASDRQQQFGSFYRPEPAYAVDSNGYRYHGGPKTND